MFRLAHLNGIKAFEAAARHQSFTLAAKEMNVTPAAIGQQIRQLEEWLGVTLFIRSNSGQARLTMTPAAQAAYPDIKRSFDLMLNGLQQLYSPLLQQSLTISVSPSFAAKWLMPRLHHFQQSYPH
ncbi:LysR family transcriptional regulator [Shewanella sp. NIFS-20-20]|uniref:LysR family transcriptional regulator n=1 Tax=Shewanella sp. NIFS-20-20 TaxID=2853806 RepID=UPI001C4897FF|nr:LysR family transcriptional regulator [Shewanella sp. NIFS-20-20]MBV7316370.1 LysR family transcriptional regulator [Shewanella sp. NIFS-20-20]